MLKKLGDLSQTQIFAKIENVEVSAMQWLLLHINFSSGKEKAADIVFKIGT